MVLLPHLFLVLVLLFAKAAASDDGTNSRLLQGAADPNKCTADGTKFTCNEENNFNLMLGPEQTQTMLIASTITCDLDDGIQFNYQHPTIIDTCTCSATLTPQSDAGGPPPNVCPCSVCPAGSVAAVAVNCTGTATPGPCPFIGCDGQPICGMGGMLPPKEEAPAGQQEPSGGMIPPKETSSSEPATSTDSEEKSSSAPAAVVTRSFMGFTTTGSTMILMMSGLLMV